MARNEMARNEDEKRVLLQKTIAAYTHYEYTQIDLSINLKNTYIAEEVKLNFCSHLCKIWRKTDADKLLRGMFDTLKTGNDILAILKR